MKITYLFAILSYILFFVRVRSSKSFVIELILFLTIVAPGIQVSGVLINPIDLVSPILLIFLLCAKTKKFRLLEFDKLYLLFILSIIISVVCNLSSYQNLFVPLLQIFRLCEVPIIVSAYRSFYRVENKIEAINSVNVYGFWLCLISIVSFFEQGTIYNAGQIITSGPLSGFSRAGGVFGEASYFGFITVILFITGVYALGFSDTMHKVNAILVIACSIVCNVLSYTRISNISLLIALLVVIIRKINFKKLILLCGALVVIAFVISRNEFLRSFVFERMLKTFDMSNGFDVASSGRLTVWRTAFSKFLESGNLLFGIGYKNVLADNMLLMSLTQAGILGLISFLLLFFALCVRVVQNTGYVCQLLVVNIALMSITCDVFTYSRPLALVFILLAMFEIRKKDAGGLIRVGELERRKN